MTTQTTTETSAARQINSGVRELVGAEVLVIDKDDRVRGGMTQLLSAAELHVTAVSDPIEAWEHVENTFYSVVVVDLDSPDPNAGIETTKTIKMLSPTSMVILLTSRKSFDDAIEGVRAGAMDVVLKTPDSVSYLKDRVLEAAGRSHEERHLDSVLNEVRNVQEGFLKELMAAERALIDLDDKMHGRDPKASHGEVIRILNVSDSAAMSEKLAGAVPSGYEVAHVSSGGQALDRISSSPFQLALVADSLPDLPGSMVVRSLKTQNPELIVLEYTPGGKCELVESTRRITIIDKFETAAQIVERLDELSQAFVARALERRYTQTFKEKHYDFLRKYVELKARIDRALQS